MKVKNITFKEKTHTQMFNSVWYNETIIIGALIYAFMQVTIKVKINNISSKCFAGHILK